AAKLHRIALAIDHLEVLQPLVAQVADLAVEPVAVAAHVFHPGLAGGAGLLVDELEELVAHRGRHGEAIGNEAQLAIEILDPAEDAVPADQLARRRDVVHEDGVARGEVAQVYAASLFDGFYLEHSGPRIAQGLEHFAFAGRELGAVGLEMVLHQGAAGGGIAEIVDVPLQKSVDFALVGLDIGCRFKVVALGAPPVALGVPAFHAMEHIAAQAAASLLPVLGFFRHLLHDYIPASRFVAAAFTIEEYDLLPQSDAPLRRIHRGERTRPGGGRRGDLCVPRAQRGGEVHHRENDDRPAGAYVRRGHGVRPECRGQSAGGEAAHRRAAGGSRVVRRSHRGRTPAAHRRHLRRAPAGDARAHHATAPRAQPGARAAHLRGVLLPRHAQEDGVRHGPAAQSPGALPGRTLRGHRPGNGEDHARPPRIRGAPRRDGLPHLAYSLHGGTHRAPDRDDPQRDQSLGFRGRRTAAIARRPLFRPGGDARRRGVGMARSFAILRALGLAYRRDWTAFQSLAGNNFFLITAFLLREAGTFVYLIMGLVVLFPLSTDPLRKIPPSRLALWPLERRERWILRLASPWINPLTWGLAALAVWGAGRIVTI